jgi:opacity protein-like surface antigen
VKDNLLAYARVGFSLNEMTIESNATWTTVNTTPLGGHPAPYTLTASDSSKTSETAYGIRLGLGAEYLLTHHLGMTLDYIYSYYGSISTSSAGAASTAMTGPPQYYNIGGTDSPSAAISIQTAMLGLLYHW